MATKTPAQEEIYAAIAGLRRVSDAFRKRREELALSVGLTEGQWGVMEEIATLHFMPSMFAKNRSSSAAAVSKTLRQLADKGLIRSSLSKADGRQRDYELTAKGEKTLQALRAERERAIAEIWRPLERDAILAFTVFATTLADRLEIYPNKER